MSERFGRPSPSMIVAIVALVVALTGSAVAGVATVSSLSKNEKRKVRNIADQRINAKAPGIADQRIDAKAPGLSVGFAAAAGDVPNQLWAVVNANGTLSRATPGITGVSHSSAGQYVVSTNRDVSGCYYVGSLGGSEVDVGLRGDISVNPSGSNSVYVLTSNQFQPAQNEDRNFTLLIRC